MFAAIDVGSNTVRMLIARLAEGKLEPVTYQQKITRLAGGFDPAIGLASPSMERTLAVFSGFMELIQRHPVEKVRAVGTAALRRAENAQHFANLVKLKTRLSLEIISGQEEARLSSAGSLSVMQPVPQHALLVDIGGGSTEIVFVADGNILFASSYPLGVVQLSEEMPCAERRREFLSDMVVKFSSDLLHSGITPEQLLGCELVGTAGTMTTLAAFNLKMHEYDRIRINNHLLAADWLKDTLAELSRLSVQQREELPGFEPGRGDVILPGLELIAVLCSYLEKPHVRVADAGLLEGILLDSYKLI